MTQDDRVMTWATRGELELAYVDAVRRAWDALARYKFWMFGYYASRAVFIGQVLHLTTVNPFRPLVEKARQELAGKELIQ